LGPGALPRRPQQPQIFRHAQHAGIGAPHPLQTAREQGTKEAMPTDQDFFELKGRVQQLESQVAALMQSTNVTFDALEANGKSIDGLGESIESLANNIIETNGVLARLLAR